jgi:hypothetical protein
MSVIYNIYCDESCHLEHDIHPVMLFGAVWCPKEQVESAVRELRKLKERHRARGELKWTKVSPSRESFFLKVVDFFFSTDSLNFRCLIVDDKQKLDHSYYNQGSHDSFYYKMYYYLIKNVISRSCNYNVYIDIKDTRSQIKINKLKEVLCNAFYDFDQSMINNIQHVRSSEVELLQLADFLMGAVSYKSRNLASSRTKLAIIDRICERSGHSLQKTTPPWESKFNLFFFSPRETC